MVDSLVHAWFKSGSRVVLGWFWGGSGVVQRVFGNSHLGRVQRGPRRTGLTRVVQKWFTRGSRM
eukprot:9448336-Pyramimonas_sp.AAC.1